MTAIENSQIKELSERVDSVDATLSHVKQDVKDIRDAILGTEFNRNQSYMARLDELETFKKTTEVKIIKAQVYATVAGFAIGAAVEFLIKYLSHPS